MQNLYNVDTTGKSYALDAAPLMQIDNKRVAVEGAKMQAMQTLAEQGAMAAETYTARRQLAKLQTDQQQLKPGTPEFEQNVARLVMENPLAFNNAFTAPVAKAGLSAMATAHAQALKSQDRVQQNKFLIERDKARFTAEKDIAETRYKKTQKAPLSLDALVGDTPAPASTQSSAPTLTPGAGDAPDLPDGQGSVDGSLLNAPEPALPDGAEGPVGMKGTPGVPAAPAAVAIPDTKSPVVRKSDPVNLDDGMTDALAKAAKYEAAARALERNGQPAEAAQARMKAIDFKTEAQKIQGSDEYQKRTQEKIKAKRDEAAAAEVAARAPEVSAALAGGYPELTDLHDAMSKEVEGAKSTVELSRLQSKWANKMATARQLLQSEGKLPDDPTKIEEVALKRDAVVRAAQAAEKADNEYGKYAGNVKPGAAKDVVEYASKLKARSAAAAEKAKQAADQYDVLKTKVGMNEPDDTADKGPKPDATAKVEDAYNKKLDSVAPDVPALEESKRMLAEKHPEVIDELQKIADENPFFRKAAIQKALSKFFVPLKDYNSSPGIFTDEGKRIFGKNFVGKSQAQSENPEAVALSIIQDFRNKKTTIPKGKSASGNTFTPLN